VFSTVVEQESRDEGAFISLSRTTTVMQSKRPNESHDLEEGDSVSRRHFLCLWREFQKPLGSPERGEATPILGGASEDILKDGNRGNRER